MRREPRGVHVSGISVSIVDDDPGSRCALASLIRSLGFSTTVFDSAAAFLASPSPAAAACLVSDLHMPEMGGLELLARMRDQRPDCPVILVTAYPSEAVEWMATEAGACGFFSKPLGADFLAALERIARDAEPLTIPRDD